VSEPLTRRADLVRDQLAHPPHGMRRPPGAAPPVRLGVSGSGAELLVLAWSATDLARERAAGTRLLVRLGVAPGMRVANTLPGALATPGSLLFGDVLEELGALDVPLGEVEDAASARQAWELVERVTPDVIVLDDASAVTFLSAAPAAPRPWWRGIVWLRVGARGARPAVPPAAGFGGWQREWLAVPEATSFVAATCAAERFHVDEGVLAEIVGGMLVLTPLGLEVPLERYATELPARLVPEPCGCGAGGPTLEMR
jgi:hypothetical protein